MRQKQVWLAVTQTLWIFGLLGWGYIVLNSEVHPITLGWQLTHFWRYPHEDTFGAICFAVAFISFLIWNVLRHSNLSDD